MNATPSRPAEGSRRSLLPAAPARVAEDVDCWASRTSAAPIMRRAVGPGGLVVLDAGSRAVAWAIWWEGRHVKVAPAQWPAGTPSRSPPATPCSARTTGCTRHVQPRDGTGAIGELPAFSSSVRRATSRRRACRGAGPDLERERGLLHGARAARTRGPSRGRRGAEELGMKTCTLQEAFTEYRRLCAALIA